MRKSQTVLEVEEKEEKTKVLFWGKDYPFIAQILKEKLEERGCQVEEKLERLFDYILIFGPQKDFSKILKQAKQGAKILLLAAEKEETLFLKEKLPIFFLTTSKSLSGNILAGQILKKLFLSQGYQRKREKTLPKSEKIFSQKKSLKPFPLKLSKKMLILALLFAAFSSPFLVSGTSLFLGVKDLEKLKNAQIPLEKREEILSRIKLKTYLAKKSFLLTEPVLSLISEQTGYISQESINILKSLTLAAEEGLFLEKIFKSETKNFLKEETIFLKERLTQTKDRVDLIDGYLAKAELAVKNLTPYKDTLLLKNSWPKLAKIPPWRKTLLQAKEALFILPELLALEGEKSYLLLLQNNFELRPTGGFIGSYGVLVFNNGRLKKLEIKDVYTADGQLKGRVEPPKAIVRYLNQPNWFLRDSNWDPDFTVSSQQAEWFLEKETGEKFDGVLAIDLFFLQNLLEALGGIYVPDYQATVTASDFFLKLQSETKEKFFPGSTKKRDLLSSLSSALLIALTEDKNLPYFAIFKALEKSLEEKHLLLYFHNPESQKITERLGWGGRILEIRCQKSKVRCLEDHLMLVEANLGVNKVNYHLQRELATTLSFSQNSVRRQIIIYYQNNSPERNGPFSGVYKNYLRVLLPKEANLQDLKINKRSLDLKKDIDVESYQEKNSFGFLVSVAPKEQVQVEINYELPLPDNDFHYQILIQKQPGTEKADFIFKIADLKNWRMKSSNFSSLPYLTHFSSDRLLTIDFAKQIK